jgi:hypothetical protein
MLFPSARKFQYRAMVWCLQIPIDLSTGFLHLDRQSGAVRISGNQSTWPNVLRYSKNAVRTLSGITVAVRSSNNHTVYHVDDTESEDWNDQVRGRKFKPVWAWVSALCMITANRY